MTINGHFKGEILLPLARASIGREFGMRHVVEQEAAWLHEPGACFVTLRQHDELRGCIGSLEPRRSLLADVEANARAAAFSDPRFAPLSEAELDDTDIELSLLSPMQSLQFRDETEALALLQPGVDGILFEYGGYRSTFLPQVWERLTTPREFLGHLKVKAGLPVNFWSNDVRVHRYSVTKYRERNFAFAAAVQQR